jgi:hypothetical protein
MLSAYREAMMAVVSRPFFHVSAFANLDRMSIQSQHQYRTSNVGTSVAISTITASSPTCRICLEPYVDPTCSVACWHVFCNDCWLRCLGSTKLCPICKHISSATSLRRVYL